MKKRSDIKLANKTNQTNASNQYEASFRVIKSQSIYNLQDYLPTNDTYQNKFSVKPINQKINREPTEFKRQYDFNEISRKLSLARQENEDLKRQLLHERKQKSEILNQNDELKLKCINMQSGFKNKQLKQKSKLSIVSGCNQANYFPKHRQQYEVSIQTENNINQSYDKTGQRIILKDREMQDIYQKLQNLKFVKKGKTDNRFEEMVVLPKQQKIKKPNIPFLWQAFSEKQNNMRESNHQLTDNKQFKLSRQAKEQMIDIYPIEPHQLETILSTFFD